MLFEIVNLCINFFEAFLFYYLVSHCLTVKYHDFRKYLLILADFSVITLCNYCPGLSNVTVSVILILCTEVLVTFLMTQNTIIEKIFWGSCSSILSLIVEYIAMYTASLIVGANVGEILSSTVTHYTSVFIYLLLLGTCVFITVQIKQKSLTFPVYVLIPLFIITLLGIFGLHALQWCSIELKKDYNEIALTQFQSYLTFIVFAFLCIFVLLYILLFIIGSIHQRNLLYRQEKELYQMEQSHYQSLHKTYQLLRIWKHDYKNHLQTISQLLSDQDTAAAADYIHQLLDDFSQTATIVDTGNAALDAIVSLKKYEAENMNIRFDYKLFLPEASRIPLTDVAFSSLLGNILTNAIEASGKTEDPFIRLEIKTVKASLLIAVENSSTGQYRYDSSRRFISTKREGDHGIGLQRIQDIVKDANGIYEAKALPDTFCTTVILPLKN